MNAQLRTVQNPGHTSGECAGCIIAAGSAGQIYTKLKKDAGSLSGIGFGNTLRLVTRTSAGNGPPGVISRATDNSRPMRQEGPFQLVGWPTSFTGVYRWNTGRSTAATTHHAAIRGTFTTGRLPRMLTTLLPQAQPSSSETVGEIRLGASVWPLPSWMRMGSEKYASDMLRAAFPKPHWVVNMASTRPLSAMLSIGKLGGTSNRFALG